MPIADLRSLTAIDNRQLEIGDNRGGIMSKAIYCNKVNPSSECDHVIRGESEEEVLQKAGIHAKEHGLEPTPELIAKVRSNIEDE